MSSRTATWLGGLTVGAAIAGSALAAFAPAVYRYPPPATVPTGSQSLWAFGLPVEFVAFAVAMAALASTVAFAARLRAAGSGGGVGLAWAATIGLFAGALAVLPGSSTLVVPAGLAADIPDAFAIGAYYLPVALVALLASFAVTLAAPALQSGAFGDASSAR